MATRTGLAGLTLRLLPKLLALLDGEKSGIAEIVFLQRLRLLGAEPEARGDVLDRIVLARRLDGVPLPMRVLEFAFGERDRAYGRCSGDCGHKRHSAHD